MASSFCWVLEKYLQITEQQPGGGKDTWRLATFPGVRVILTYIVSDVDAVLALYDQDKLMESLRLTKLPDRATQLSTVRKDPFIGLKFFDGVNSRRIQLNFKTVVDSESFHTALIPWISIKPAQPRLAASAASSSAYISTPLPNYPNPKPAVSAAGRLAALRGQSGVDNNAAQHAGNYASGFAPETPTPFSQNEPRSSALSASQAKFSHVDYRTSLFPGSQGHFSQVELRIPASQAMLSQNDLMMNPAAEMWTQATEQSPEDLSQRLLLPPSHARLRYPETTNFELQSSGMPAIQAAASTAQFAPSNVMSRTIYDIDQPRMSLQGVPVDHAPGSRIATDLCPKTASVVLNVQPAISGGASAAPGAPKQQTFERGSTMTLEDVVRLPDKELAALIRQLVENEPFRALCDKLDVNISERVLNKTYGRGA
ncbi:hypothetical protein BJ742DRAFT_45804 [Cladochytrium replicatum]|nr:hypothetical protein BJ742DRAFT_45804 [Cladochytrium replicatum]